MIEYKQKLKVRNLQAVYDGLYGCPPGKTVAFFAEKDSDGVIALSRSIYYDSSEVSLSERNDNLICTFFRSINNAIINEKEFMDRLTISLHKKFDIEEM